MFFGTATAMDQRLAHARVELTGRSESARSLPGLHRRPTLLSAPRSGAHHDAIVQDLVQPVPRDAWRLPVWMGRAELTVSAADEDLTAITLCESAEASVTRTGSPSTTSVLADLRR